MAKVILGVVLGLMIGGGVSLAHSGGNALPKPLNCKYVTTGRRSFQQTNYACTLSTLPNPTLGAYEFRVPALDLDCTVNGESRTAGIDAAFACERLSLLDPSVVVKCTDGVLGSLSTYISVRRMEIDKPANCVPTTTPPYWKATTNSIHHVYYRNP
jgi:hypothetical protein